MAKATVFLPVVSLLLLAVSFSENVKRASTFMAEVGKDAGKTFFEENEPLHIRIPAIDLETELGLAPVIGGRLDCIQLKKRPILISAKANSSLRKIGLPGTSLILGHRQWGLKPLIFARLNELKNNDSIIIFNENLTLFYKIYEKMEINPQQLWGVIDKISKKSQIDNKSTIILLSCAPYGYNWHRLLVFGERKVEPANEVKRSCYHSCP